MHIINAIVVLFLLLVTVLTAITIICGTSTILGAIWHRDKALYVELMLVCQLLAPSLFPDVMVLGITGILMLKFIDYISN